MKLNVAIYVPSLPSSRQPDSRPPVGRCSSTPRCRPVRLRRRPCGRSGEDCRVRGRPATNVKSSRRPPDLLSTDRVSPSIRSTQRLSYSLKRVINGLMIRAGGKGGEDPSLIKMYRPVGTITMTIHRCIRFAGISRVLQFFSNKYKNKWVILRL